MGQGKKAFYKPPPGFQKGRDDNGEYSFSTPDANFYISINTKWIDGRTPEKILEQSLTGIRAEACEDKNHKTAVSQAVWKICRVDVGGRKEGRLWMVIVVNGMQDAIEIGVHFREMNESRMQSIQKSIDEIRW